MPTSSTRARRSSPSTRSCGSTATSVGGTATCVDAFQRFLWTEDAQRIFVKYGFRSVIDRLNEGSTAFGRIEDPFRIADMGGWKRAKKEIVDAVWKERVLKELGK